MIKKNCKNPDVLRMVRERCMICNFKGHNSHEVSPNYLYEAGNVQTILLCYNHSVELFKVGQMVFLVKYKVGFEEHGLDTNRFFENSNSFFSYR